MEAKTPLVAVESFVAASRDSGYKGIGSAIAELIDNALEANARTISVRLSNANKQALNKGKKSTVQIVVTDDGIGMSPKILPLALQFGGSTRFGSRKGTGRYGMGLPSGSVSQACRVEVFSWIRPSEIWMTYIDIEEILSGRMLRIPSPKPIPASRLNPRTRSGTIVVLKKCDRLEGLPIAVLRQELEGELGRTFRKFLYSGCRILLNGAAVRPVDPLFIHPGLNMKGARLYGPPIEYRVRVPRSVQWHSPTSTVTVRFSELPIESWHRFSNAEKNEFGIAKNAGVSIVRAGREIDYGWYFLGAKRKENYDDWWRCEVSFCPELDELFGVTHSKQGINPTELVDSILTPEIERTARELNSRIRKQFAEIRAKQACKTSMKRFQARDHLLEPPGKPAKPTTVSPSLLRSRSRGVRGLKFAVTHERIEKADLYSVSLRQGELRLVLNELHPFYSRVYSRFANCGSRNDQEALQSLELLLVAGARAQQMLKRSNEREIMMRFLKIWGDTIASFLS